VKLPGNYESLDLLLVCVNQSSRCEILGQLSGMLPQRGQVPGLQEMEFISVNTLGRVAIPDSDWWLLIVISH